VVDGAVHGGRLSSADALHPGDGARQRGGGAVSRPAPPRREAFAVWEPVSVRWGDMDAMGHVNNARFFTYCESARIRYFAALALPPVEAAPAAPLVVTASCTFRRQVRFPAELEVGVRCARAGTTSFELAYGIFPAGEAEAVADGVSVVVWTDVASGRPVPLPAELRRRLVDVDGVG
jgi:acyl-CoA thioester hydrolase